jgi:hypothetical protein
MNKNALCQTMAAQQVRRKPAKAFKAISAAFGY